MNKTCQTCGASFEPKNAGAAARRKFCSNRCRKAQYSRPCVDCGKPLDGSAGRGPNAPTRCCRCDGLAKTIWTSETVVAAIRRFAERYGRAPVASDFSPAHADATGHPDATLKRSRFDGDGDYPYASIVQAVFGSWNAGIEAAGFRSRGPADRLSDERKRETTHA